MLARMLGSAIFGASVVCVAWVGLKVWIGLRALKKSTPPLAPLVLFTDLEPDDLVAMWVLKKRNITPTAIVVGEGNVDNKVARAIQYAKDLGWTRTLIRAGMPSSACTPDGEVPAMSDTDRAVVSTNWWDMDTTLGLLELCRDPQPTFLCLKPPRELVSALAKGPCGALSHVRLLIYGSCNLRQVGWDKVVTWFNPDTTPFRQVLWFENHGGLSDNTRDLNLDTLRGALDEALDETPDEAVRNPFCARASGFARVWDAYMERDCQETMAGIEARGPGWRSDPVAALQHARNHRSLLELQKFQGRRVVAADPVLAVVMDDPDFEPYSSRVVSVTLLEKPETSPTVRMSGPPGGDGKVLKLVHLPAELVLAKLAPAWQDIFGA